MIELQTSVKQDDTTRTRTPKPGYLNLSTVKMAARLMALDFQYLEIDGVEFYTYWQNGGYKKISDIIFAEWHIFIVSNLCPNGGSQQIHVVTSLARAQRTVS